MTSATLALGGLIAAATAVLYVHVGLVMLRRPAQPANLLPLRMFATWWLSLGVYTGVTATQTLLASVDALHQAVHETLLLVGILPLTIALLGLLYYLTYLQVGKDWILWPILGGYALVYALLVHVTLRLDPKGIVPGTWSVRTDFTYPMEGGVLWLVLGIIILPLLVAAAFYGSLIFRIKERGPRIRIALVSGSFLLWLGALPLAGTALHLNEHFLWPLLTRIAGVLVPLLILAAYRPPAVMARWMNGPADAS